MGVLIVCITESLFAIEFEVLGGWVKIACKIAYVLNGRSLSKCEGRGSLTVGSIQKKKTMTVLGHFAVPALNYCHLFHF